MKSKDKSTLFILAGAVAAGLGGWFITQSYIDTEVSAHKKSFDNERHAVSVVVAAKELNIGDVINLGNAQMRNIPKTYVPLDAVSPKDFAQFLEGRQIKHKIRVGEPILKIHVSNLKMEGISSLLGPGERAITIPVSSKDTFSGFLKPGDLVDIFVTVKDGPYERTAPMLQKLKVLATGIDLDDGIQEASQKKYSEITLTVSPMQATKLIHSQSVGDLSVLLRRDEDKSEEFDGYVTIDNLLDTKQETPLPPPPPALPPPTAKPLGGFELIKGGNKS